jgi:hypothetical protein
VSHESPLASNPIANALRGALIAYGVALFSWWFARALPAHDTNDWRPGSLHMTALGVLLQIAAWVAKWLATRYERAHGMRGMLTPSVVGIAQVIIDGVTVLLFAVATFRGVVLVPATI